MKKLLSVFSITPKSKPLDPSVSRGTPNQTLMLQALQAGNDLQELYKM